ncbi:MAG: energy transducer TonB [Gillisia sp.]
MEVKKNYKADLTKRSLLFLQLGLIFILLLVYLGIEWKTYAAQEIYLEQISMGDIEEEIIPITELPTPPPPKLPTPPEIIEVVPDDPDVIEDPIESTESSQETIIDIKKIEEAPNDDPVEAVPFILIENVPVYPGCEGLSNNEERKKCMSDKITEFVNKRFNSDLGSQLGLTGINRIHVLFQIDTQGNIVGVQSRAPHPKLEQEAARVINSLPKMKPGMQRGKAVPVSYALPIAFKVQD